VTDLHFAAEMEALFLRDVESSVEVSLVSSARVPGMGIKERRAVERVMAERPAEHDESSTRMAAREARQRSFRGTEVSRYLGRLARAASVLARALAGQRTIGREDAGWVSVWGVILLGVAAVGFFFPRVAALPMALLFLLLGIATFVRILTHRREPPDGGVVDDLTE
jgi:cardiolipin synthase